MVCSGFMARASERGNVLVFIVGYLLASAGAATGYAFVFFTRPSTLPAAELKTMKEGAMMFGVLLALDSIMLLPAAVLLDGSAEL